MLGVINLASTAHQSVFVLFAVNPGPLGMSKTGFGLLLASGGVGGLAGSTVAAPLERTLGRARCLVAAIVVFAVSLAVPFVTTSSVANAAAIIGAAFGAVVWNVITVSLRQRITPDHLLGRMNSAYRLLGWGTMPLGALLGGVVAETVGVRPTFLVAALLHLPLLLGFRVVAEARIAKAEAEGADTLQE